MEQVLSLKLGAAAKQSQSWPAWASRAEKVLSLPLPLSLAHSSWPLFRVQFKASESQKLSLETNFSLASRE